MTPEQHDILKDWMQSITTRVAQLAFKIAILEQENDELRQRIGLPLADRTTPLDRAMKALREAKN